MEVGDIVDQGRQPHEFDAIVRSPGLAARVVGDSLHLMRHQVGGGAKPSQGRVKLGMLGQPVLEEFDIRNNDLGRGADLVPDLGHEELLAFGFRDLGGPGRGGRFQQHLPLALHGLRSQPVAELMGFQQLVGRAANLIRNSIHRPAVCHEQERCRPRARRLDEHRSDEERGNVRGSEGPVAAVRGWQQVHGTDAHRTHCTEGISDGLGNFRDGRINKQRCRTPHQADQVGVPVERAIEALLHGRVR